MVRLGNYRLDPLASLLVGVVLLCGVGILEGLPPCLRDADRGVPRAASPTVSDASEHTDWMSEMSKSEASLPRRLLPRLPALLPGRLEFLLVSKNATNMAKGKEIKVAVAWGRYSPPSVWFRAFSTAALIRVPSSPD